MKLNYKISFLVFGCTYLEMQAACFCCHYFIIFMKWHSQLQSILFEIHLDSSLKLIPKCVYPLFVCLLLHLKLFGARAVYTVLMYSTFEQI